VAFSRAEQNVFVTAGNDGTVCFWRVTADKPYRIVKGHQGSVMGVAFSPDAKLLATGGGTLEHGKWAHGEIGLWNVESGERLRTLKFDDWGSNCVAFSGDGKLVCFSKNSSFDNVSSTIEVYDVSTWKCIRSISFWPGFALSVSFFPDSRQVLIAGGFCEPREQGCSPTGKIWVASANDDDAHELEKLDDGAGEWHGYFRGAAVLMTGDRFFTTKDAPRAARNVEKPQRGKPIVAVFEMRDAKNGKLIWSRDSDISTGGGSLVTVSPDGKTVGCCDQNKIMVLESESGKFVRGIGVE